MAEQNVILLHLCVIHKTQQGRINMLQRQKGAYGGNRVMRHFTMIKVQSVFTFFSVILECLYLLRV